MKEFKEDKLELEDKIKALIKEFNDKYDVYVNDINIAYIDMTKTSIIVKIDFDME